MNDSLPYTTLLSEIEQRIRSAQTRAALAVNRELIRLYWHIGQLLLQRQADAGWGAAVIPRLARDIARAVPGIKGFSARNLDRMTAFARAYPQPRSISPQPVAKLAAPARDAASSEEDDSLLWQLPWGHHASILQATRNADHRLWYMKQAISQGWSRSTLQAQLKGDAHLRHGTAVTNFSRHMTPADSHEANQLLKDPYVFDFLTLEADYRESELEIALVEHLESFLVELGQGFAFVGRQHQLTVRGCDFFVDLLFYHLGLRRYLAIELKRGEFKPEYAGKLNFYCNVVDDLLRKEGDAPTIGLMLCQDKDSVLAEYALRGIELAAGAFAQRPAQHREHRSRAERAPATHDERGRLVKIRPPTPRNLASTPPSASLASPHRTPPSAVHPSGQGEAPWPGMSGARAWNRARFRRAS